MTAATVENGPVARYIEELRSVGGLRGTDIANIASVSKPTVSRWAGGAMKPQPRTQLLLSDLRYVVDRLRDYYAPDEIRAWLYARHPQLDGQRAVDLIAGGDSEPVLRVLDRLDADVYLQKPVAGGTRDAALLDALEAVPPVAFEGTVWRVVREGRDPRRCSAVGGRWDDGSFEVLYTASAAEGAVAEMRFHLSRGQPIMPSRVRYELHALRLRLTAALRMPDLPSLARIGLDTSRWGRLAHADRTGEYPRSQEIAEAAFFLGFDGLIVPSARWDSLNVIPFFERLAPDGCEVEKKHGIVAWEAWTDRPGSGQQSSVRDEP